MDTDLKDNQKIKRNVFLVKLENLGKKRKRLLIITIVLLFSMAIGLEMMPDAKEQSNYVADKKEENSAEEVKKSDTEAAQEPENKPDEGSSKPVKVNTEEQTAPLVPVVEEKTDVPAPAPTLENKQKVSQKGAIQTAENYLRIKGFSRSGLIEQLKFEQFSEADATYAVDNIKIDYNEQAKKSAESYMTIKGFSRGGLIDQLKFEGFTQSQAEYGADSVGL